MLRGYYVSREGYKINLIGYDFDSYLSFIGSCSSEKMRVKLDRGVVLDGERYYSNWNELYIQVNVGDIKVDDIRIEGEKTDFNISSRLHYKGYEVYLYSSARGGLLSS